LNRESGKRREWQPLMDTDYRLDYLDRYNEIIMDENCYIILKTVLTSIPEFIRLAFSALAGGLLGAYINDRLTRKRESERDKRLRNEKADDDKKNRDEQCKTNFRAVISELRARAAKVVNFEFQSWYSNMQIEVEKQCALVENSICLQMQKQFEGAWEESAKPVNRSDLADPQEEKLRFPVGLDRLPDVTYERGKSRAIAILDKLHEASK
jgi:hypothetical protein